MAFNTPAATDYATNLHLQNHINLETQTILNTGANTFTGLQSFTAGVDVTGSPSGYTDEVRLSGGASGSHAISTTDTGAGHLRFDHRGTANTGDWFWGNGANVTRMTLSATGKLSAMAVDHWFGIGADGSTNGTYIRIGSEGDPNNAYVLADGSGTSATNVGMTLRVKGSGIHSFEDQAGTAHVQFDTNGGVLAKGADHYFGPFAFSTGTTVTRLHMTYNAGTSATLAVEGDSGNRNLNMKIFGTGTFQWQTAAGGTLMSLDSTGYLSVGTGPNLQVTGNADLVPKTAALLTTATTGFMYIRTCAGAPTGVPGTFTGCNALVYDTTNNKLWAYNGAWRGVVLA